MRKFFYTVFCLFIAVNIAVSSYVPWNDSRTEKASDASSKDRTTTEKPYRQSREALHTVRSHAFQNHPAPPRDIWPNDSVNDSIIHVQDSITEAMDSIFGDDFLKRISRRDTVLPGNAGADTVKVDTLKKRSAGIDVPVEYRASDSLVYDATTRQAYLYGKAQVKYTNMTLDAHKMTMIMDSSKVYAQGKVDTAGVMTEKPTYRQGNDEYVSEEMAMNFKTKKGFIEHVSTTQGNGYVQGMKAKRDSNGIFYMEKGKYTTCDAEHPHFYLALSRMKVRPAKDVVFGPAYLVVEDVPLPLAIPYGFFPFNKKYSSGIVMPSYGDETTRGFYLRDGGYYFAINDYMDLKLLGEIYTKGSWGLSAETNYRKRYRYNGNFFVSFLRSVEGEKNMPDYNVTKSLKVLWTHSKDAKASPNTTFSARVNFASESYERNNLSSMYNPISYTQSTRSSSVSFSHNFTKIGLSLSLSSNLTQNMRDSTIALTLPELSLSLTRFYPFRRSKQVGKERWYEKISMSYTGNMSNSITTKEDKLLHSNLIKDWRNGMQHSIPIDATFQVLKYINVSPSFNFRDIMYTNKIKRSWDEDNQRELQDTVYGFYNLYSWNMALSANTTLYGFYKPWKKLFGDKIIAVRHVLKPSVSLSYSPDFTSSRYGYFDTYVKTDADGNVSTVSYSPYSNGLYGYPSNKTQGTVSMTLSNNLEMKIKSDRDSTGEKKISLIDELAGTLSYNLAAKTRPWSDLSTRIRLKLSKSYTFSMAAVFATYAYAFNESGAVVTSDRTEWSYGRFGRFGGMSQNISYTLNNEKVRKLWNTLTGQGYLNRKNQDENTSQEEETDTEESNIDPNLKSSQKGAKKVKAKVDDDGYLAFSMPWSLSLSYGISMYEDRSKEINVRTMRYPYSFSQTFNCSGYVRIADGWNITFSSGYDFTNHKVSMTTASLSRDLHCFEMSASVVLRPYTSFNFTFRARANELTDALKWDKRSSYSSNIEWY